MSAAGFALDLLVTLKMDSKGFRCAAVTAAEVAAASAPKGKGNKGAEVPKPVEGGEEEEEREVPTPPLSEAITPLIGVEKKGFEVGPPVHPHSRSSMAGLCGFLHRTPPSPPLARLSSSLFRPPPLILASPTLVFSPPFSLSLPLPCSPTPPSQPTTQSTPTPPFASPPCRRRWVSHSRCPLQRGGANPPSSSPPSPLSCMRWRARPECIKTSSSPSAYRAC